RRGGAAFHIAGAASVDAVADELAAPWVLRPAGAIADREHVDMAIEGEVASGLPRFERRDDVRHDLVRRDDAKFYAMPRQVLADVLRRFARVAGRVGAGAADKAAEEIEQHLSVALDALQQLRLAAFHLPSSGCAHASSTRSRTQLSISWTSGSR